MSLEWKFQAPVASDAPSEVVSDGDEVEGKVCYLLPVPTDPSPTLGMALRRGGGGIGSTGSPISSSASVSTGSGTSFSSSSVVPSSLKSYACSSNGQPLRGLLHLRLLNLHPPLTGGVNVIQ
jgi:hypothetical protein